MTGGDGNIGEQTGAGTQTPDEAARKQAGIVKMVIGAITMVASVAVYAAGEAAANNDGPCGFDGCEPSVAIILASAGLAGLGMGVFFWGIQTYRGEKLAIAVRDISRTPTPEPAAGAPLPAVPSSVLRADSSSAATGTAAPESAVPGPADSSAAAGGPSDVAAALTELQRLVDCGLISSDEYDTKRAEILRRL